MLENCIYCEHLREDQAWDRAAFSFDIDVNLYGKRYTLFLCDGCYNRLIGAIINKIIKYTFAKEIGRAMRRSTVGRR